MVVLPLFDKQASRECGTRPLDLGVLGPDLLPLLYSTPSLVYEKWQGVRLYVFYVIVKPVVKSHVLVHLYRATFLNN